MVGETKRRRLAGTPAEPNLRRVDETRTSGQWQLGSNDQLSWIIEEISQAISSSATREDLYYLALGVLQPQKSQVVVGRVLNWDKSVAGMSFGACINVPEDEYQRDYRFTEAQLQKALAKVLLRILECLRDEDLKDLEGLFLDKIYQGKIFVQWEEHGARLNSSPVAISVGFRLGIPAEEYDGL